MTSIFWCLVRFLNHCLGGSCFLRNEWSWQDIRIFSMHTQPSYRFISRCTLPEFLMLYIWLHKDKHNSKVVIFKAFTTIQKVWALTYDVIMEQVQWVWGHEQYTWHLYSDADKKKDQSSASLAFVWGIHRERWIPRTKGQLRGKCFHLMTSSCQR